MTDDNRGLMLVVDDDPNQLELLKFAFKRKIKSIKVHAADSPGKALKMAARNQYDLFIIDVLMRGKNGVELAEAIRDIEGYKEVPIFFLSAANKNELPLNEKYPENTFFEKPIKENRLVEEAEEVIALRQIYEQLTETQTKVRQVKELMLGED